MQFLRRQDLQAKLGVSKTTVYRLIKEGIIPKPTKLLGTSVWNERDIDEVMSKVARSENKEPSDV